MKTFEIVYKDSLGVEKTIRRRAGSPEAAELSLQNKFPGAIVITIKEIE